MVRREQKPYTPRYFVVTQSPFAWRRISEALGRPVSDREEIAIENGKIPALEVTLAEARLLGAARHHTEHALEIYQELWSGEYARLEEPLRERSVVRTTTDPKAREAVEAALRTRQRATSPLRRDRTPVSRRIRW